MNEHVNKDQIQQARRADLYGFLLTHHDDCIVREGKCIRLKDHHSIVVKPGYSGYIRFSDRDETGNPIDLLVKYLGYSFTMAVRALASNGNTIPETAFKQTDTIIATCIESFPEKVELPFKRVYAYLTQTRLLSEEAVRLLIDRGLVYQDKNGNAVFINREGTYCELRGTLSQVKYHRSFRKESEPPGYWSFKAGTGRAEAVYICEGAIDAISLYELCRASGGSLHSSIFCSIGGVGNQRVIDWIAKKSKCEVVLAVDNDPAGAECRSSNPDLDTRVPHGKDWNEDLKALKMGYCLRL